MSDRTDKPEDSMGGMRTPQIVVTSTAGFQRVPPVDAAYIAAANPQAILALLDELTYERHRNAEIARGWDATESRVAALEEGLRDVVQCWDGGLVDTDYDRIASSFDTARALLDPAALPAEVGEVKRRLRRFWRRLWANPPTVVRIRSEVRDPSKMDVIAARLAAQGSSDDPISDSRQPEDGPPPGRWQR